jgi:hypothetical protein
MSFSSLFVLHNNRSGLRGEENIRKKICVSGMMLDDLSEIRGKDTRIN